MRAFALVFALAAVACADVVAAQAGREQVRVKTKHANAQMGPNSTTQVIVLVPQGAMLPVIERRGPWVLVELSPKLRETGIPMRWYKSEKQGWIHDSYLDPPKR